MTYDAPAVLVKTREGIIKPIHPDLHPHLHATLLKEYECATQAGIRFSMENGQILADISGYQPLN